MDIQALSAHISQIDLPIKVGTEVLSMSLDTLEQAGENLTKMMEQSVTPTLGQTIDIRL